MFFDGVTPRKPFANVEPPHAHLQLLDRGTPHHLQALLQAPLQHRTRLHNLSDEYTARAAAPVDLVAAAEFVPARPYSSELWT